MTPNEKLDYWAKMMYAAREGIVPDHDCRGESCQTCIDFYEAKQEVIYIEKTYGNKYETKSNRHN